MKRNLRLAAALGFLSSLTLITSCANLNQQLHDASVQKGQTEAKVTLPDLPPDCRKLEPHAILRVGGEARTAFRKEWQALDRQNARTTRCDNFYDALKSGLE